MKSKIVTAALWSLLLVSVSIGAMALVNTLTLNTKINGRVVDVNGSGLQGVTIIVIDSSGVKEVGKAYTDKQGYYSIAGLPEGTYQLKCIGKGFGEELRTGVVVSNGKNIVTERFTIDESIAISEESPTDSTYSFSWADAPATRYMEMKMPKRTFNIVIADGTAFEKTADIEVDNYNTTEYSTITENQIERVKENPLSTFSIDVDVASYSLMRSYITAGNLPPADAVRIEELINYFTYSYKQPQGNLPFTTVTEMGECPWNSKHKLLHIGINGKEIERKNQPPSNLVFLLDVSGSMDDANKLGLVKQSLRLLVNELDERDRIAIVVYAGASGLALPSTSCKHKDKIIAALNDLEAGGSTAGAEGIALAYKVAQQNFMPNGNNRVILCTDGDFNVGISSEGELVRLIEKKREGGVFLSVLGYGMGNYKDNKMEKLADKGNGNYAYIDNILEANKVLVQEMGGTLHTIAKDVKIQVEFNPDFVKGYRLIGYENRKLADRDFNDDSKDAGEIGAGAGVTALYEIITDERELKQLPQADKLKYQHVAQETPIVKSNEWLTVKIRYKEPNGSVSKLIETPVTSEGIMLAQTSDDFRFSAAVASFGMLLRESEFKGNADYDKVLVSAKAAKGADTDGYRAEFIRLVEATKRIGAVSKR